MSFRIPFPIALLILFIAASCTECPETTDGTTLSASTYFDNSGRDDVVSGGVKMIPVETPSGTFKVWTKRIGNNPDIKVLVLHGGPGLTHEYLEGIDSHFPGAGFEYYHYDQLGSAYSDQPEDTALWVLDRFVEEVEQVRRALGLNSDNCYIVGHSWGGILGLEYALKYQDNIKGLVISNMMCSAPAYNDYAQNVLGPGLGDEIFSRIKAFEDAGDFGNEEYHHLVYDNYYPKHVLRKPMADWPEPVLRSLGHVNPAIYVGMQGPSEFGIAGNASLKSWDRSGDLGQLTIPVLTIGATYDTMDPEHMEWMAGQIPDGSYLHCPNGSHLALYDDPDVYFDGLIKWIKDVDAR